MDENEKRLFTNLLCEIVGSDHVNVDEPMKRHTTFRIGGNADYLVSPHSTEEIKKVISACRQAQVPYYVIGNGSNLLVSDSGYRGVILRIFKNFGMISAEDTHIRVQAGALLSKVARKALDGALAGFEFAAGIPGTIGGAIVMNAGAYGGEMKDVVETVTVLTPEGEIQKLQNVQLEFGYRTSVVSKRDYVVLEATLSLRRGERDEIRAKMDGLREKRMEKQPLDYPSAGSTFKRPEGYFAGKLIMDAGLRGFRVGGAQVSEKHCGFVINNTDASASDVWKLIKEVSAKVEEQTGVALEPEVRMLGEFE